MASPNDRTWPLKVVLDNVDSPGISCSDLNQSTLMTKRDITINVRGDYSIGQVMVNTTGTFDIKQDWTDYAFWWPKKKKWLKQTRMTLDQVDVHANDVLHFTTMHKMLYLQMPDLSRVEMAVDFSVNVLSAVSQLCSTLNIRHAEELSLARPLSRKELKNNRPHLNASPLQRPLTPTEKGMSPSRSNLNKSSTLGKRSNGSQLNVSYGTISSNNSMNSSNYSLSSPDAYRAALLRPKSTIEKARINSAWLNSSISLYEQDVCAYDLLMLKYKFFEFFDLNPKIDVARVNYIYEQLKWAIICEEINCTDDEMYTLGAINLQVALASGGGRLLAGNAANGTMHTNRFNGGNGTLANGTNGLSPPPSAYSYATIDSPRTNGYFQFNGHNGNGHANGGTNGQNGDNGHNGYNGYSSNGTNGFVSMAPVDEIDSALEDLEKTLEGTYIESSRGTNGYSNGKHMNGQNNNLLVIPELMDKLKINSQRGTATLSRFKLLNSEKSFFVLLRETTLSVYKSAEQKEKQPNEPAFKLNIHSCEVKSDVLASQKRYCFQIIEPQREGAVIHLIRCRDEDQYAKWFTACKHASIGRTMAHASYNEEVKKTLKLLQIQTSTKSPTSQNSPVDLESLNINLEEFVSQRLLKRKSKEQILRKLKNVHSNFVKESPMEAQMSFIKTCQSLRDYGTTLFVVRFSKSKKEDLLGVAPNKLVLIDINNGSLLKSWRYNTLIDWNINWEVKKMQINFNEEDIEFECLSADCKVIHEYIGGYIYMSMRNKDNDRLDEQEFLKLTGGWNELEHSSEDEQLRLAAGI